MLFAQGRREIHILAGRGRDGHTSGGRESFSAFAVWRFGWAAGGLPLEPVWPVRHLFPQNGGAAKEGCPDVRRWQTQDAGRYGKNNRLGGAIRRADLPIPRFGG